jgi:hypothetical protein
MLLNDSKQYIWEKKGETLIDIQFVVCFFFDLKITSGIKGKLRAEQFSFYPLLCVPTTERRRAQRGAK